MVVKKKRHSRVPSWCAVAPSSFVGLMSMLMEDRVVVSSISAGRNTKSTNGGEAKPPGARAPADWTSTTLSTTEKAGSTTWLIFGEVEADIGGQLMAKAGKNTKLTT